MLLSISFHLLVFNYIWKKNLRGNQTTLAAASSFLMSSGEHHQPFFSYQLHIKISRTSNSTAVRRIEKHYVVIACHTSEGQGSTSMAWEWQTRRNELPTAAGQHRATQRAQCSRPICLLCWRNRSFPKIWGCRECVRCGIQFCSNQSQTQCGEGTLPKKLAVMPRHLQHLLGTIPARAQPALGRALQCAQGCSSPTTNSFIPMTAPFRTSWHILPTTEPCKWLYLTRKTDLCCF